MTTTVDDLLATWRTAEADAFGALGWTPGMPDVYSIALTDDGAWTGEVRLPKNTRGGVVNQEYPAPGVIHRPTEDLLARLESYEPGTAPPPQTVSAVLDHVVPPPESFRYSRITVRRAEDVPDAVARTVELVRDRLLPWQRRHTDPDLVRDHLAGRPYLKILRAGNLRRLVLFEHLRGDDAGARTALDTYLAEYAEGLTPQDPAHHDSFVAGVGALLSRPR
ncbi:hypothetical protein [Actinocatenispora rupis]|uniref:Uncharacterized protein n=1 Tax=Actinocatenispora rupis TaxID=519421 RepID=A0A8J3J6H0_9ACTN|nr:hypothetical protein [Actinocatenispora rupis]GID15705.1 hypothetical protein Aru02nite_65940 [Actinocatenispora rupis]